MIGKCYEFVQKAIKYKLIVECHFEQIIGIIMIENNSLSILSRVFTDSIDWIPPIFYEFDNINGKFS